MWPQTNLSVSAQKIRRHCAQSRKFSFITVTRYCLYLLEICKGMNMERKGTAHLFLAFLILLDICYSLLQKESLKLI